MNLKTCPVCRGYEVERQWCSCCNGSGFIIPSAKEDTRHA